MGIGLEDGNNHSRDNLPFIIAGKGGGTIKSGRYLPDTKGNQGDLLTTILGCAGIRLIAQSVSQRNRLAKWSTVSKVLDERKEDELMEALEGRSGSE